MELGRRRFIIIEIITGTPTKAVIALIGNCNPFPGIYVRMSQQSITIMPKRIVEGIKILWLDVLKITLAKCGIAIPINPIGPTKAVNVPIIIAVRTIIINLIFLIFKPKLFAYISPNKSRFRYFGMRNTTAIVIKFIGIT